MGRNPSGLIQAILKGLPGLYGRENRQSMSWMRHGETDHQEHGPAILGLAQWEMLLLEGYVAMSEDNFDGPKWGSTGAALAVEARDDAQQSTFTLDPPKQRTIWARMSIKLKSHDLVKSILS